MQIAGWITVQGKPEMEAELRQLFKEAVADFRAEPGSVMAAVLRDRDTPAKFHIFEVYKDQDAVEAHRASPQTVARGPLFASLLAEPHQAKFFEILEWSDKK